MMTYNNKVFFITVLSILFCLFAGIGCTEDEAASNDNVYVVDIQIVSPEEGIVLKANEAFTVKVVYTRKNDIVHNILIEILNEENQVVQTLMDAHQHEMNGYTFEKEDVVITEPGMYKLLAITTDHGKGENRKSQLFSIE